MRYLKLISIALIFLIFASGCLVKEPAKVDITIDKSVVKEENVFHIIVRINNTGKVAITGINLYLNDPRFKISQKPKFDAPLGVGEAREFIWIVKAPKDTGRYFLKASVEVTDELQRTWGGFYKEFIINVIEKENEIPPLGILNAIITSPTEVTGGNDFQLQITLQNVGNGPVKIKGISIYPLEGMEVTKTPSLPNDISPGEIIKLNYTIKTPYMPKTGYLTISIVYMEGDIEKRELKNKFVKVIWMPWDYGEEILKTAYGEEYYWIHLQYLVDEYWKEKFNSSPIVDRDVLRNTFLKAIYGAQSEKEAAQKVYNFITSKYSLGNKTTSLNPTEIMSKKEISYEEATLLFTGALRSLNIPSRVISLYNGTDCTQNAISEFYSAGLWYVVDFKRGFFGSRKEYLSTPYFPKTYQMLTQGVYNLVAHSPEELKGHEHLDVTPEYLVNIEKDLTEGVMDKLSPVLKPRLSMVLVDMGKNERIFTLFLFASAPEDELNLIFEKTTPKNLAKNIDALYSFYKDKPWPEDFREYWNILKEVYE